VNLDTVATHLLPLFPRGRDHAPIEYSCGVPSKVLSIDTSGNCFLCRCAAWLPVTVGNILSFNSLEEIWNSATAKFLQDDIAQKKYTYCAVKHCGIVASDMYIHKAIYNISLDIDESCNLACPSCRTSQIAHTKGDIFEEKAAYINHFLTLLDQFDKPLHLTMCGNGDPLASMSFRPLVLGWIPKVGQTVELFTNGLLMKKLLSNSIILPNISKFQISIDAGSQSVYEIVRWPGKFSALQDNLQWLVNNQPHHSVVTLNFCISKNNASDIINFANLCSQYKFNGYLSKLENWRTFADFDDHDVIGNINHPLHEQVISDLLLVMDNPHITLNSLLIDIIGRL